MYTSSIHSGNKYANLQRSIAILISNCNLDKLNDIPEFLTKWNIRKEKYILDQQAVEDYGYDKGLSAGIERGKMLGIEQGIEQKQIEIVKK